MSGCPRLGAKSTSRTYQRTTGQDNCTITCFFGVLGKNALASLVRTGGGGGGGGQSGGAGISVSEIQKEET